jgi:hypothetical protein
MTPSGRTKKLGQQLSRAAVLLQLIQTWLLAAAARIAASMVICGRVEPLLSLWNLGPTWSRMACMRLGGM